MIERFFRDSAWLFLMEFLVRFKALIVLPILTRQLGTADFGVWSQVSVLTALLVPIAILGTDGAMMRYLPGKGMGQQSRQFSATLVYVLVSAALLASLLYLFREPLAKLFFGGDARYAELMPLAALSLLTAATIACLRTWWRLRNDAKRFGAIAVVQGVLGIGAVLAAILSGGDVSDVIGWTIVGDALLVIALAAMLARGKVWSVPDWSVLPLFMRFGATVLPAGFAMWGINYADRIFLLRFSDIGTVGIYALAYSLSSLLVQAATGPIWAMYYTAAAELHFKQDQSSIQRLFDRSIEAIFLVASPIISILIFCGGDMLSILATPVFASGALVMPIIAGGYLVLMVSSYFEASLGLDNKQYVSTYAAMAALASNLALNVLLIPPFGMAGAAVATLACCAVQTSISHWFCRRGNLINVSLHYPLYALACAVIAWGIATASVEWIQNVWLRLVAGAALGLIGYAILLPVSGGLPPDLRRWLLRKTTLLVGKGIWPRRF